MEQAVQPITLWQCTQKVLRFQNTRAAIAPFLSCSWTNYPKYQWTWTLCAILHFTFLYQGLRVKNKNGSQAKLRLNHDDASRGHDPQILKSRFFFLNACKVTWLFKSKMFYLPFKHYEISLIFVEQFVQKTFIKKI